MQESRLDDLLDAIVAEYSDRLRGGVPPERAEFLARVPAEVRPALERSLKMIEAGLAATPSAARPLAPGMRFDGYELVRPVGRGGMALVWLAQDAELRRPVALKILRPGLALEERHADRFRREALAIARLQHPNVLQVHGVGEAHGYHYIAMEYVEGPSLATVLEALPTDRPRTAEDLARATGVPALAADGASYEAALARLLAPVASALQAAHDRGLVHRDVKPSNILLRRDGRPVVADFGLAKGADDPALSLTGDALGTPFYMSPEQAYVTSWKLDHRTDVYSLGVTLYEALTGARPFRGDSFLEVVEAIRSTLPPPLRAVVRGASRDAEAVVRRAMAREPEDRYASARELEEDLVALSQGLGTQALAREGSRWQRARMHLRLMRSGQPYEYRSARRFLGLPLVHVHAGPRRAGAPRRVARGWLAVGDVAVGGVAFGTLAFGGLAWGAVAGGLFSWGAFALGGLCFGGFGLGVVSFAGVSLGYLAVGGLAAGYAALGGAAYGVYAAGGAASGRHVATGLERDPAAVEWFERMAAPLWGWWN